MKIGNAGFWVLPESRKRPAKPVIDVDEKKGALGLPFFAPPGGGERPPVVPAACEVAGKDRRNRAL